MSPILSRCFLPTMHMQSPSQARMQSTSLPTLRNRLSPSTALPVQSSEPLLISDNRHDPRLQYKNVCQILVLCCKVGVTWTASFKSATVWSEHMPRKLSYMPRVHDEFDVQVSIVQNTFCGLAQNTPTEWYRKVES